MAQGFSYAMQQPRISLRFIELLASISRSSAVAEKLAT
jgi:hypothetical protein